MFSSSIIGQLYLTESDQQRIIRLDLTKSPNMDSSSLIIDLEPFDECYPDTLTPIALGRFVGWLVRESSLCFANTVLSGISTCKLLLKLRKTLLLELLVSSLAYRNIK